MALARPPVCFTCGQPIGEPPRINTLASGEPCGACRDRLLDSLPPLLPGSAPVEVYEEEAEGDEPYPFGPTGGPYGLPPEEGFSDPPAGA